MQKYLAAAAVVVVIIVIAIIAYAVSAGHIDLTQFGGAAEEPAPSGGNETGGGNTTPTPDPAGGTTTTPNPDPAETDDSTPYDTPIPDETSTTPPNPLDKFNVTKGTAMPGNNLKTINNEFQTPQECAQACLNYDGCRSFDWKAPTGDGAKGSNCYISGTTTAENALYKSGYGAWDYYEVK